MHETDRADITDLLRDWNAGDSGAAEKVLPLVYDELRLIAASYFRRERRGHTLQATAIVHEAYLRLIEDSGVEWQNRAHFVGRIAHMMRHILVDHAREQQAAKRGGKAQRVTLAEAMPLTPGRPPDLIELDQALNDLARLDPRKASIVELRFFGGLTIPEVAQVFEVSPSTVFRQWRLAKTWLYRQLSGAAVLSRPRSDRLR